MWRWLSRRLLAGVIGSAVTGALIKFGFTAEQAALIVTPLVAWILGQSHVDAMAARNGSLASAAIAKSEPPPEIAKAAVIDAHDGKVGK